VQIQRNPLLACNIPMPSHPHTPFRSCSTFALRLTVVLTAAFASLLPNPSSFHAGDYYTSFDAACKHRKDRISSFCDAVKATGLTSALSPKGGLDATVFVPNNAAFAKVQGKPSAETLAKILKYHVVPGKAGFRAWAVAEAPVDSGSLTLTEP